MLRFVAVSSTLCQEHGLGSPTHPFDADETRGNCREKREFRLGGFRGFSGVSTSAFSLLGQPLYTVTTITFAPWHIGTGEYNICQFGWNHRHSTRVPRDISSGLRWLGPPQIPGVATPLHGSMLSFFSAGTMLGALKTSVLFPGN